MYCTVKEIIRDVLDTDVPDSECVFAVVLTRGDVRHIAQDWNLSDDELETVMQRLDDAFEYGADVRNWLTLKQNILLTGATGSGKTFLACALGHNA
ncbi:ATP-binding protein, partial [Escherichia coli]